MYDCAAGMYTLLKHFNGKHWPMNTQSKPSTVTHDLFWATIRARNYHASLKLTTSHIVVMVGHGSEHNPSVFWRDRDQVEKDLQNVYRNSMAEYPICAHGFKPNALDTYKMVFVRS